MIDRYNQCFTRLSQSGQGAFVPFVTLGDPDLDTSFQIICTLVDSGADALELGIPFSDPVADGPTIQRSAIRALAAGATVSNCFALIKRVRDKYPQVPIGLLVYSNLVVANTADDFYGRCSQAGVDSVLVADVPVMESERFNAAASAYGISTIYIATPNASEQQLELVAKQSNGYTYLLSRAGVTGTESNAGMPIGSIVEKLRRYQAPPLLLGFGISAPEQVAKAIASGADGVICGSAIVQLIESRLQNSDLMLQALSGFCLQMKQATQLAGKVAIGEV